jgi:hypothetical protein
LERRKIIRTKTNEQSLEDERAGIRKLWTVSTKNLSSYTRLARCQQEK